MAKKIEISNLKNVQSLIFEMPPSGVWLLTGENGSGKTTLLACLNRLGDRNSFPKHFQTSTKSDRLDRYSDARIAFSINNSRVTYAYAGERWVSRPRKNASVPHLT
ncbi:ATP-binding protein [Roseinatronobacter sp.]|uniref:ATP-binding protein n=1 Tax=Roseinatronobacter sp. TaxID=1945755 RepID=UPI00342DEFFA